MNSSVTTSVHAHNVGRLDVPAKHSVQQDSASKLSSDTLLHKDKHDRSLLRAQAHERLLRCIALQSMHMRTCDQQT
jgi:hypothetical protein